MNFELTRDEAAALARFIELLRKRLPGDIWHKPGIEDALGQARHRASAPDLACAAIRAAEIPTNRTPAVIGMDGPHWRESTAPPRPARLAPGERCTACDQPEDHRLHTSGDHPFYRKSEVPDFDVSAIVDDLRARVHHGQPVVAPRKTLDDYDRDPAVQRVRDQMTAAQAALELERAAQAKHPTPPVAPQDMAETEAPR